MYPFINVFGLFKLPLYGLFAVIGFSTAFLLIYIRCRLKKLDTMTYTNCALMCIAGGFAGAFLLKPIIELPALFTDFDRYIKYFGEIVFYGGLIGGVIAGLIFIKFAKMSFWTVLDLFAPAIPLGHAFGRIGCFFGGCCYGQMVSEDCWLGVHYPHDAVTNVPRGVAVLALPLIEACFNLLLVFIILAAERLIKLPGLGLLIYAFGYSIGRFVLEFFRGDLVRGVYSGISTSQIISLIVFASTIVLMVFSIRHYKRTLK